MSRPEVRILEVSDDAPRLDLADEDSGVVQAIVWPGVGATKRTFHRFRLLPRGRSREQRHEGEAVYYVVAGSARVTDSDGIAQDLREGSMVHVEPGTAYVFEAGGQGAELIGGPCPADESLYASIR